MPSASHQRAQMWCGLILNMLVLMLAGCQLTPPPPRLGARPVMIRDFAFEISQVHGDSGLVANRHGPVKRVIETVHPKEAPEDKAARLAALLSESIAKELNGSGISAMREVPGTAVPTNAFLVGGQFLERDEGSRLRRAIVGFGAGASEVVVEVSVFDLAQDPERPAIQFGTGSGSKSQPGAIIMLNPYSAAAKFVLSRNAGEKDIRKLAKEIALHIEMIDAAAQPHP